MMIIGETLHMALKRYLPLSKYKQPFREHKLLVYPTSGVPIRAFQFAVQRWPYERPWINSLCCSVRLEASVHVLFACTNDG